MSHDAFGFPVRKYDFGKDGQLAGPTKVLGAQYRMQEHLVWARGDALTCAAGVNTYLPFDVPPLPAGSIIRAYVHGTFSTNDEIGIGLSVDWLLGTPTRSQMATATLSGVSAGLNLLQLVTRTRSTWRGASLSCEGTGVDFNGSSGIDFAISNRLAVYALETTAIVLHYATVEVFIPRVYR